MEEVSQTLIAQNWMRNEMEEAVPNMDKTCSIDFQDQPAPKDYQIDITMTTSNEMLIF